MRPHLRFTVVCLLLIQVTLAGFGAEAEASVKELKALANRDVKDPAESLALATRLRGAGLYKDAVRLTKVAIVRAPAEPLLKRLQLELARNEMERSKMAQILEACKPLAALDALLSRICLAEAQLSYHRATLALPEAQAALELDKQDYDAQVAYARALRMGGQTSDAMMVLAALVDQDPDRIEAYPHLARLQLDTGNRAVAIATLRKGISVGPENAELHFMLGSLLPPGEEALKLLSSALELRENYGDAYAALGAIQLRLKRYAEAEKSLRNALTLKPKTAPIATDLGQLLLERGDAEGALRQARSALKWLPSFAAAKLLEARGLAANGDIDGAIETFQAAYGMDRKNPDVLIIAARACLSATRATTALAFAERASVDFAKFGPAWEVLGDVAAATGEVATARNAYTEALKLDGLADRASVQQKLAQLK